MSHEIDQTTGKAAVFVTGEPAWHRLGVIVREAQTSADAIRLARLDWTVDQWPLQAARTFQIDAEGQERTETRAVETHVANIRGDTGAVLGVVSTAYRVFQNREAFDFMDSLVAEKLAMFETAGAIRGGRRVWMMARLPQELRAAYDDVIKPYILLSNSHDGSMALRMIPTTVRVVCQNTLNLALRSAKADEGLVIRHFERLQDRVKEAREKLGVVVQRMEEFGEQAQALARTSLTTEELGQYFASLVADRSERQQKKLLGTFLANFENERNSLPGIRGSVWAAFNAASEWADHQMGVRTTGECAKLESRLNSIWFGASNSFKQDAFQAALALAS